MKYIVISIIKRISQFTGVNPKSVVDTFRGLPIYLWNIWKYSRQAQKSKSAFPLKLRYLYPNLSDRYSKAGEAKGHYFHQDLWAARKIFKYKPIEHIDIGSRIDGFVSHLLVFRSVSVVDVRSLDATVDGLTFHKGDITDLDYADNSIESLSCLHAIEHVGLGRYGDKIFEDGWRQGLCELERVLKEGGRLYLGVPIGVQKVYFDAHRIFDPLTIIDNFVSLKLVSFSYVDDQGDFHKNVNVDDVPKLEYGCGLFEFRK